MLPTESAAFKIGYLFFSLDRSRSAADNPQKTGVIAEFCKKRGHGFITPDESPDRLFVHVSEYVFFFQLS